MTNEIRIQKLQALKVRYRMDDDLLVFILPSGKVKSIKSSKFSQVWIAMLTGDDAWITETKNDILRSIVSIEALRVEEE